MELKSRRGFFLPLTRTVLLHMQDPCCVKVSIMGEAKPVSPEEEEQARGAMFARHPQMAAWPAGNLPL